MWILALYISSRHCYTELTIELNDNGCWKCMGCTSCISMHAEVMLCGMWLLKQTLSTWLWLDQFPHPPFPHYMGITQSNTYSPSSHDTKTEPIRMPHIPYKAVEHSMVVTFPAMPLAHLQHTCHTPFLASWKNYPPVSHDATLYGNTRP